MSVGIEQVKSEFPAIYGRDNVYLDSAATTQTPRSVLQSMYHFAELGIGNVHRSGHAWARNASRWYEDAREKVREFINAEHAEEVIFTPGATAGINMMAHSWCRRLECNGVGGAVLVSDAEHHSNLAPWHTLVSRLSDDEDARSYLPSEMRRVHIQRDGSLTRSAINASLQLPRLRYHRPILAITAMSNVTGIVNPIAELVDVAQEAGAWTLVDAAQVVSRQKIDVRSWGADAIVFSGHKMYGPTGIGVVYVRTEMMDEIAAPFVGGGAIEECSVGYHIRSDVPMEFEPGTPPIVQAVGLSVAIDFLNELGMDSVEQHTRELSMYLYESLASLPAVKILGEAPELRLGIVSFTVDGIDNVDVGDFLDKEFVAVRVGHHCAQPIHRFFGVDGSVRASLGVYNTKYDVNALIMALKKCIARGGVHE